MTRNGFIFLCLVLAILDRWLEETEISDSKCEVILNLPGGGNLEWILVSITWHCRRNSSCNLWWTLCSGGLHSTRKEGWLLLGRPTWVFFQFGKWCLFYSLPTSMLNVDCAATSWGWRLRLKLLVIPRLRLLVMTSIALPLFTSVGLGLGIQYKY